MISKLSAFLAMLAFLFSCSAAESSNEIVLKMIFSKGQAEALSGKYVYLVAYSKKTVIDSALVTGDTVVFNSQPDPDFVPYEVSLQRFDTSGGHPYLRPFGVQSPYDRSFTYSSFYLDRGLTVLKPFDRNDREYGHFEGSKQNEPFLKGVNLEYAPGNSKDREKIIAQNISLIKSYPYSVHLLGQLFNYKEKFLNEDLKSQLAHFNVDVQRTPMFKSFTEYFGTSSTHDRTFPSIQFEGSQGSLESVGRAGAAYYLVVYWASWCLPCRKEIPAIKELYTRFSDKGLAITSISIDADRRDWQTALQEERMPWQQLIAINSTKAYLDLHYSIKAIPKAYLFNQKKELVTTYEDPFVMTRSITQLLDK